MTLNTQAMNDTHESAPSRDWRRRSLTRVAVCLLSWWACGVSYAAPLITFPSLPLQTGVTQPAPNIIFILDDSGSMTSVGGDALDTGLTWCTDANCPNQPALPTGDADSAGGGAPYTKNPLSYNPATNYQPWAYANNSDTSVLRQPAAAYNSASKDLALYTGGAGNVDLTTSTQTFYVPKPSTIQTDRRNYYRYQVLSGSPGKLVRSEWVNNDNTTANVSFTNQSASAGSWNNSGGSGNSSNSGSQTFVVNPGVTQVVIATSGTLNSGRNPGIYVNLGANPSRTAPTYSANASNSNVNETLTITNPPVGTYRVGVFNWGTSGITGETITVTLTTQETALGCTQSASSYGWKKCLDISNTGDPTTGVRTLALEELNYANWYQYHRTRMKAAKAGGSEAFAKLDSNYRVGLMGLFPSGSEQQVFGGNTSGAAPTATNPGNLNNIIPVDTNGGLFINNNRKNWFDAFQAMNSKSTTPLRKALDAAGKYFSSARAYQSTVSGDTTYLACRQNFTIMSTDGYWNNYGGNTDPDSNYSGTKISGDEEDGAQITGPNNQSFQYQKAAPYWYNALGDYQDDTTLADIAMNYWKTDLRTTDVTGYPGSADNRVPFSVANPAFWQHMVTFGVGLGVRGYLTDDQVKIAMSGTGTAGNGGFWPHPVHATDGADHPENVDDLRHAALNGHGSFINANDAAQFSAGLADALSRIGERRGSASNVLANSTSISTESFVYQATYTAGSWRGELLAYPISSAGLGAPQWRASEHIRAWGSRNIFTWGATSGSTFPSSTQLTALAAPATTLGLASGTVLANYLKGDGSKEKHNGGVLRDRLMRNSQDVLAPALLGDIVDSSPFYVTDSQTVFVGTNGGMLVAIDASNATASADNTSGGGTERFTYIPRGVDMSTLAQLADPLYGTNTATKPHQFFVDGPLVVSTQARTPGKNYLVGSLGRGGVGVFGLDVTNPGTFGASNVLWDKTGSASAPADMGNVISEPLISKLNSGVTAAVVANGPNSSTGTASLFIINLDTGATIAELNTSTSNNGLSAPRAVDVNADGLVDFFFAGDLQGNLWRFTVSDTSPTNWTVNKVFTAQDASSNPQPISSAPGVARDPDTGNIWVFFGTGRYITSTDQASTSVQTYYGIVVGPNGSTNTNVARSSLQQRTIDVVDATTGRRAFEPAGAGIDAGKLGWYIDLNNPAGKGERVISAPLLIGSDLIFSSIVPPSAATVNSCDAGGSGYVNALDAFSGKSLSTPFFDLVAPTITDSSGNVLAVGSLPIAAGMPTAPIIIGNQLVVGDSSGGTPTSVGINSPGSSSTRRVSWRELVTQ